MIYFTGDTHGEIDINKLSTSYWKEQKELTRDDYLIIAGDFGLPFSSSDIDESGHIINKSCLYWLKWLKNKPFTILFVDGNHDNHTYWDSRPVSIWNGGKVHFHPYADNIIHLMRGEVYTIDNKTIFTFGGAASHDVSPIYDNYRNCIWRGRTEGLNWWKREIASPEEIDNAKKNLKKYNNKVDIIVTHTPPKSFVENIGIYSNQDKTAEFLDTIVNNVNYNMWICGHVHKHIIINNIVSIYNEIESFDYIKRRLV